MSLFTHLAGMLLSKQETLFQTGKHTAMLLGIVGTYMGLWFFSGILEKLGVFAILRVVLLVVSVFFAGLLTCAVIYDGLCRRRHKDTLTVWQ